MQVTETLSEGLKRELRVVVPAAELDSRLSNRLNELKNQVQIKGFRPGKVPVAHLRRIYGRSAMAEIVQTVLNETTQKALADRNERPAMQPDLTLAEDQTEAEKVLAGAADLSYSVKYEVLPHFELADFKGLRVERPVFSPPEEEVAAALDRLADSARTYTPKDGPADRGDRVTMSYVGKIDDVPFEGGSDENGMIRLGSGQFIPGFEDQLLGIAAGESRVVTVTFPEDYGAANLAGKAASFDVTAKEVAVPGEVTIDDELARRFGLENAERLRQAVREQVEGQYAMRIRQRIKRQVLDHLDSLHRFDLPPTMVEQEFGGIWSEMTREMERDKRSFADSGTTEEAARADYRKIAERRVRLGLVLSEIGERNGIAISDEEVQRALANQIRQFPGQEKQVYDFYRANPQALASLRAPLFEEKVVDFLLDGADVVDRPMDRDTLMREDEDQAIPA